MNPFTRLLIAVLVAALALAACGSDDASPADTVRALVHAQEQHDRDRLRALFCDTTLASVLFPVSSADPPRFTDMRYTVESESGSRAEVIAQGSVAPHAESPDHTPVHWHITLHQRGGDWCIAGVSASWSVDVPIYGEN